LFSKSVQLNEKGIGHYLNIKHYQSVGVITDIVKMNSMHCNSLQFMFSVDNYSYFMVIFVIF
ncbi:hypothetical protein, partial [Escherichia coli]|uniref:hypothetical protein n=1 Tax=Escherichia coli TaxID=562 RepID=UPI001BB279E2